MCALLLCYSRCPDCTSFIASMTPGPLSSKPRLIPSLGHPSRERKQNEIKLLKLLVCFFSLKEVGTKNLAGKKKFRGKTVDDLCFGIFWHRWLQGWLMTLITLASTLLLPHCKKKKGAFLPGQKSKFLTWLFWQLLMLCSLWQRPTMNWWKLRGRKSQKREAAERCNCRQRQVVGSCLLNVVMENHD